MTEQKVRPEDRIDNSVHLVSITPDAERNILYMARVSSNQENTSPGLINYLIKNKHWSPFELAHMAVEIRTSRAIAAQILRHRSFSFQEFSQRYSEPPGPILYSGRRQALKNRQSSIDDLPEEIQREWIILQQDTYHACFKAYKQAIELGIAKECARFLLPLATETKLYMSGTIRSWIHYLELRTDEHTQLEHRKIAEAIKLIFADNLPVISHALGWLV